MSVIEDVTVVVISYGFYNPLSFKLDSISVLNSYADPERFIRGWGGGSSSDMFFG